MLLSSEGLLCPFHIVNTEAKESLQQKIQPLPAEAVNKGTTGELFILHVI